MEGKKSSRHDEARAALPEELRAVFDELVADYRFSTLKHYSQAFVSYPVLADLVRVGWRCTAAEQKP